MSNEDNVEEKDNIQEESNNEESNTTENAKGQEAESENGSGEEDFNEGSDENEKEAEDDSGKEYSVEEIVEEMYEALTDELDSNDNILNEEDYEIIYRILDDQVKNIVVEFIINNKISFRQIVNTEISIKESNERVIGTLKRNFVAFEKLSKEYKDKHNQEIMFMDQAEVTSIKQLKDEEEDKKK